jgi:LEA14-like dessication related protein
MKSKITLIGIFILVLAIIASGVIFIYRAEITACYIPSVEQIGVIDIKVKSDTSYISSKLTVKNKTFLKIQIDTIKYKVSLFDKMYLQSQRYIGMALRGYGTDTLDFSLKIPYVTILKDLKAERKKGDSASYSINISLQYSTAFGKAEMPINKSAKIKIPQPPELEVVEIKYKKIRLKSILAEAKIKIINYSAVTLSVKEMRYSMNILKQGNLKGNYRGLFDIKPKGTTFINLPIEINPTNLGKTIFDIVINKDTYDYTLTLNAILESSDPLKESLHIDLTKNGKMELKK